MLPHKLLEPTRLSELFSQVGDRQPNALDYLLAEQSGVHVIANTFVVYVYQ